MGRRSVLAVAAAVASVAAALAATTTAALADGDLMRSRVKQALRAGVGAGSESESDDALQLKLGATALVWDAATQTATLTALAAANQQASSTAAFMHTLMALVEENTQSKATTQLQVAAAAVDVRTACPGGCQFEVTGLGAFKTDANGNVCHILDDTDRAVCYGGPKPAYYYADFDALKYLPGVSKATPPKRDCPRTCDVALPSGHIMHFNGYQPKGQAQICHWANPTVYVHCMDKNMVRLASLPSFLGVTDPNAVKDCDGCSFGLRDYNIPLTAPDLYDRYYIDGQGQTMCSWPSTAHMMACGNPQDTDYYSRDFLTSPSNPAPRYIGTCPCVFPPLPIKSGQTSTNFGIFITDTTFHLYRYDLNSLSLCHWANVNDLNRCGGGWDYGIKLTKFPFHVSPAAGTELSFNCPCPPPQSPPSWWESVWSSISDFFSSTVANFFTDLAKVTANWAVNTYNQASSAIVTVFNNDLAPSALAVQNYFASGNPPEFERDIATAADKAKDVAKEVGKQVQQIVADICALPAAKLVLKQTCAIALKAAVCAGTKGRAPGCTDAFDPSKAAKIAAVKFVLKCAVMDSLIAIMNGAVCDGVPDAIADALVAAYPSAQYDVPCLVAIESMCTAPPFTCAYDNRAVCTPQFYVQNYKVLADIL